MREVSVRVRNANSWSVFTRMMEGRRYVRVRTRALIHRNANEMIKRKPPQMPNIASDVCDHLVRVPDVL